MATFLLRRAIPSLLCSPYRRTVPRIDSGLRGSLRKLTTLCLLAAVSSFSAAALADNVEVSGQIRTYGIVRHVADTGPLALANALRPGTAAVDPSSGTAQAELRGTGSAGPISWNASGTVQVQSFEGSGAVTQSWINEAYVSGKAGAWQWSAGKKVVSWDVGFGFRPNDVVQQETRRTLTNDTLEGRPLLMAEHFDAETAWSLVWVNPTEHRANTGAQEGALAARVYQRAGAVDWHGFLRQGEHTGTSLGAAASWIASDALELHASVRTYAHADTSNSANTGTTLSTTNPWRASQSDAGTQILLGGTWTHESQVSVMMEAWRDETALTDAQWNSWNNRNRALPLWASKGVPAAAIAGNLAWQSSAFSASKNLRQDNLFARVSWQHERWQTALDVLYTPADQGHITTASAIWSGEQIKIEGGLRIHGGPEDAIVRQLPIQRQAYLVGTWPF